MGLFMYPQTVQSDQKYINLLFWNGGDIVAAAWERGDDTYSLYPILGLAPENEFTNRPLLL